MSDAVSKLCSKRHKSHRKQQRQCEVCEETATGIHYGGLACASCKAFFLRSVRNNLHTKYSCLGDQNCTLVHLKRKSCPACRYVKCRSIGMEPKWVMSGETFQEKQLVLLKECRMVVLSDDDMKKVISLVRIYNDLAELIRPTEIERGFIAEFGSAIPRVKAASAAATLRLRTVQFISRVTDFHNIQLTSRNSLIRDRYFIVGILRHAYNFHHRRKLLPLGEIVPEWYLEKCSTPCMLQFEKLRDNVQKCQLDEPCVVLLMILGACSPDVQDPNDSRVIQAVQEQYISILHKYVYWRYGPHKARSVFPKLLLLLADAQLAGDYAQREKHTWLENYEVDFYERKIPHVNPFQQYSLERRDNDFVPSIRDPYNVLQDSSPSLDMVDRFMSAIAGTQAITSNNKESTLVVSSDSSSCTDLFDLIESLEYCIT